jgi:hypothetical protein
MGLHERQSAVWKQWAREYPFHAAFLLWVRAVWRLFRARLRGVREGK